MHEIMCSDIIDSVGHNPIHDGAKCRYPNCFKGVDMALSVGKLQDYEEFKKIWEEIALIEGREYKDFVDLK